MSTSSAASRILLTPGDVNGIGPEVALKALLQLREQLHLPVVLLGSPEIWRFYADLNPEFDLPLTPVRHLEDVPVSGFGLYNLEPANMKRSAERLTPEPGKLTRSGGYISMMAIEAATKACINRQASAVVTGPISKEAVNLAGFSISGHTDYLAEQDGAEQVVMMLVSGDLRVVPLTTHIPIKDVSRAITSEPIIQKCKTIDTSLRRDFGIEAPRIAVLGLNPHAGDGGIIGREEIAQIRPALSRLKKEGITADGPFPADGFFASRGYENYDAVLSMYHDQGLVPFKTLTFNKGVNFTAGISFIRTSPDHGTAYTLAGKQKAEAGSMVEAIEMAHRLSLRHGGKGASAASSPINS
ncbi:MAG: 4-hydroxythreonine-4-phosphate dehydrogenase PdxA [Cyclonatronaceae bacterium]